MQYIYPTYCLRPFSLSLLLIVVTQIQGRITDSSPPSPLGFVPFILSREDFSPRFPSRLASICAYPRYVGVFCCWSSSFFFFIIRRQNLTAVRFELQDQRYQHSRVTIRPSGLPVRCGGVISANWNSSYWAVSGIYIILSFIGVWAHGRPLRLPCSYDRFFRLTLELESTTEQLVGSFFFFVLINTCGDEALWHHQSHDRVICIGLLYHYSSKQ